MTAVANSSAAWMDLLCQRLSRILGWNVVYESRDPDALAMFAERSDWSVSIKDGGDVLGDLTLRRSDLVVPRVGAEVAQQLTTLLAEIIADRIIAGRKLDSRSEQLSTMVQLSRELPRRNNVALALDRLMQAATQLSGFWASAFWLWDPASQSLRLRSTFRVERATVPHPRRSWIESPLERQALAQGAAVVYRDDPTAEVSLPSGSAVGVCVPVCVGEGPLGALWCFERRQRPVSEREIQAIQSVASQMAAVLERTVLLRESAAQQQLRSELQAASIHHPPSALGILPTDGLLDIAVRTASAAELSGDLCEVWPVDRQRSLIALGDAIGHSIPAALVLAVARGSLRTLLTPTTVETIRTAEIVGRVNQALCTVTRSEQFMTLVVGLFDQQDRTLTYSNAGHPLPLLIRRGVCTPLESHGLLLGVVADTQYRQSRILLETDDLLVFFTDGLTEVMSAQRELFRPQGLANALLQQRWSTAAEAADAAWQSVERYGQGGRINDDRTLLVVRVIR